MRHYITCDQPYIDIADPCCGIFFRIRAEEGGDVIWIMHGERRVIPNALICDAWRVWQSREALSRLGRVEGLALTPIGFFRSQTVALEDYLKDRPEVIGDQSANAAHHD
jgi:hypothetical protein